VLGLIGVFLVAFSGISQVQASKVEQDFDLVFQEAASGHLVEAENLFAAAMEKYFVPGQTPPNEAISGVF
jgi:hypothetical protein